MYQAVPLAYHFVHVLNCNLIHCGCASLLGTVSERMAMRLLWEYTSTDCTEHGSVCKSCYSEISLELSILVKMFAQHFGHNIDNVIYSGVCSLLVYTHEGKLLSILLFLFPLSSPLSVELVVAGSGTQELAVFSCVPRDLGLCCSVSLQ